jgi:hypothetical protein
VDGVLWSCAIVACLADAFYSLEAVPPGMEEFAGADKVGHAAASFVILLLLLLVAVWRPGRGVGRFPRAEPKLAAGLIVAGAIMELLQQAFTSRSAEVLDVVLEAVGVGAAVLAFHLIRRFAAGP